MKLAWATSLVRANSGGKGGTPVLELYSLSTAYGNHTLERVAKARYLTELPRDKGYKSLAQSLV
jgi:hypothetical protein